ncbi:hypothetical protein ACUSIJ_29000 [Pseudochelatococcus sp. B33]
MRKYLKILVITVCLLVVAAFAVLLMRRMLTPDYTVYNRERWINEKSAHPSDNRRSLMIRDIERRLRVGMTQLEVVDLLGLPDGPRGEKFGYGLGTPGFAGDYDVFIVEFDADRKVTRWYVLPG